MCLFASNNGIVLTILAIFYLIKGTFANKLK